MTIPLAPLRAGTTSDLGADGRSSGVPPPRFPCTSMADSLDCNDCNSHQGSVYGEPTIAAFTAI